MRSESGNETKVWIGNEIRVGLGMRLKSKSEKEMRSTHQHSCKSG